MKLQTQFVANTGMVAIAIGMGGGCFYLGLKDSPRAADSLWLAATLLGLAGIWRMWVTGQRLTRDLEDLMVRARRVAAGDFSGAPLMFTSCAEMERLGTARNATTLRLQGLTNALMNISGALSRNFSSMRVVGDGMHQRIDQQSQQTQQAAAAMTEMSASIGEVSRHTQDAAQTARDASQTAREGGVIVSRVLDSIEKIAAGVMETSNTMGLLGKDSMKISQIVTVIDDIAKKTNLLALNAAIEAARAGEQGRGFAVVAVEVRRLAVSTAKARGEISNMIENIQQRANAAVVTTEVGTAAVSEGLATTKQAGAALERIIGMADRVDRMIAQIAIATAQQAAAADQSSASLDAIHALSGDNLNDMATSAQGIDSLRSAASDLKLEVERLFIPMSPAVRALPDATGELQPTWG